MENNTDNKEMNEKDQQGATPNDTNDSTDNEQGHEKKKRHVSALQAAAVARSATERVSHHSGADLASSGTNISYEGATAPGGGGSVGTGYASGQSAAGEVVNTHNEDADTQATYKNKNERKTENKNERKTEDANEEKEKDTDTE